MVESSTIDPWLLKIFNPSLENSCFFLDTCKQAPETKDGGNFIVNYHEAMILILILRAILQVFYLIKLL